MIKKKNKRIITLQYGSAMQCFLVARPLRRAYACERPAAPYHAYEEPNHGDFQLLVVSIDELDPISVHFVRKSDVAGGGILLSCASYECI